jgi:hypothetical protein
MSHFTPHQPFRPAINRVKCIYTKLSSAVSSSSTTTRSFTLTLPTPGLASLWLYASPHSFTKPTNNTTGSRLHSFTFYRLINDKMRTSLTFLTLLAAAGSAVAAPVPASNGGNGAVQKIVSGHHRRSDSQVMVDMKEHLVSSLRRDIRLD